MSGDAVTGGLSGALAAALADVEALAEQKVKNAERDQVRQAVDSVTAAGDAQLGPDIRGMPAEEAARLAPTAQGVRRGLTAGQPHTTPQDGDDTATPLQTPSREAAALRETRALRALSEQHEQLRQQVVDEQAQTLRLSRQLDEARNDLKATRQRFRRLSDQFEDVQRRQARQEADLPARLRKQLIKNFLPALDSLDAVTSSLLGDDGLSPDMSAGVEMLRASFGRALSLSEVVVFDATGQRFDPVVHEAIAEEVDADVPQGTVLRQVGRGYLLGGKLLRSAQVVVSRTAAPR